MASNHFRWAGAAGLLFCTILQVILVGGIQSDSGKVTTQTVSTLPPSGSHGIEKRSVSILARNGDLPYYRKEWNKKLHPGFRGMNVENKDELAEVDKRYVGALARGGGFPVGTGKRSLYRYNSITGILPEEAILEAYLADELRQKLLQRELAAENDELNVATEGGYEEDPEASNEYNEKRGGVGSLARGGYMPSEGRYSSGKRSLAALARSGEILSIGRGSSHDREGGNGANKRGYGSLLRSGGISTIGKIPVYNVGKRGIESLARNYALPSMLNQEYAKKYDLIDNEDDDISSIQMTKPLYEEFEAVDENDDAQDMIPQEDMIKRHLGSFARTYGLRPGNKRNIGSIVRNGGMFYNGKRNEENSPQYDEDYFLNNKRHISSLLRNQGSYIPVKKDNEDRYASGDAEKRHLSSILHDRNSFANGKRYLGSLYRQGLPGVRHDKRENLEGIYEDGQWNRGDLTVGKRSIAEESGSRSGENDLNQQDGGNESNRTTEDELKNAASPISSVAMQKRSTDQQIDGNSSEKEKYKSDRPNSSHRQRRSIEMPYSTSDEYPMPVMQNTDFYDLETADEDELTGSPDKRFMGRIPHMGRSRPRTGSHSQSPTRRRPRYH